MSITKAVKHPLTTKVSGEDVMLYPFTVEECVSDANGNKLSDKIDTIHTVLAHSVFAKESVDKSLEIPHNADTLGDKTLEEIQNDYISRIKTVNQQVNVNTNKVTGLSNPNIIMNPDFKINQRGSSSYYNTFTSSKIQKTYTFDRWFLQTDGINYSNYSGYKLSLSRNDDGVSLYSPCGLGELRQYLDIGNSHANLDVTYDLKMCLNNNTTVQTYIVIDDIFIDDSLATWVYNSEHTATWYSKTFKMPPATDYDYNTVQFVIKFIGTAKSSVTIYHVKMEYGKKYTNFIPPDPTIELLRCKKYYQRIEARNNARISHGVVASNTTTGYFKMPLNVPMRTVPTTIFENFYVWNPICGYLKVNELSILNMAENNYHGTIRTVCEANDDLTTGMVLDLVSHSGIGYIEFDAEFY